MIPSGGGVHERRTAAAAREDTAHGAAAAGAGGPARQARPSRRAGRADGIGRFRAAAWWAAFGLIGALVLGHFALLQINNMPLSPLKLHSENLLSRYINPFFTQRWNFFAPTPPTEDEWVVARVRYRAPAGEVVTPWINISQPLIDAIAGNRWTPLFLVEIGLSNAANALLNRLETDPRSSVSRAGKTYLAARIPEDVDPGDLAYIRRTALASLEIAFPNRRLEGVQVGLMEYRYPRFTQRAAKVSGEPPALMAAPWSAAPWVTPYCCPAGRFPAWQR